MTKPTPPTSLTLPAAAYDQLLALVQWLNATPNGIDLGDHLWEYVHYRITSPVDDLLGEDWSCTSVETEGVSGLTAFAVNNTDEEEHRVVLIRGE